ncbi:MAG: response regulator [Anaerolineaceae bacterium]|nr:response regulator [Anaerolineaceae bacterium]
MPIHILAIDDEPIYHKMIAHALEPAGYKLTFANNGSLGLATATALKPDLIITDVLMPDINGYEVVKRLRREPGFAHTPILMLTCQTEMSEKLNAFEAGADDYMTKPFDPGELVARVTVWVRRLEEIRNSEELEKDETDKAQIIAFHSLRGGIGCSSLAVNTAMAMSELWKLPTLLVDGVLTAGQIALMLNASLKRTWADIAGLTPEELDYDALRSIVSMHNSGIHFIAGPSTPISAEMVSGEIVDTAIRLMRPYYEYIILDLPHDFSEITLFMLDQADLIIVPMAPEMASIRAADAALGVYKKLGYPATKTKMVLNKTIDVSVLDQRKIEKALKIEFEAVIPYTPGPFTRAINIGQAVFHNTPNTDVSQILEDLAYSTSKESHRTITPEEPTSTWQKVHARAMRNMPIEAEKEEPDLPF